MRIFTILLVILSFSLSVSANSYRIPTKIECINLHKMYEDKLNIYVYTVQKYGKSNYTRSLLSDLLTLKPKIDLCHKLYNK